LVNEMP